MSVIVDLVTLTRRFADQSTTEGTVTVLRTDLDTVLNDQSEDVDAALNGQVAVNFQQE